MSRPAALRPLLGFFLSKLAFGAAVSSIVWTWLVDAEGAWRGDAPLLPLVFGIALPSLLGWIPLTISGAFLARPRVRQFVAWIPGVALILFLVTRELSAHWLEDQYQFILGVGVLSVMQVGVIALGVSESWLKLNTSSQRSLATAAGWILGSLITAFGGAGFGVPWSPSIAVLLYGIAGLLLGRSGRRQTNPWIPAERSIGRFARLLDLLGGDAPLRNSLILVASFAAMIFAALASLPGLAARWGNVPTPAVAILGGVLAGIALGIAAGSTPWIAFSSRWWKPRLAFPILTAGAIIALAGFVFIPSRAAWLFPLVGVPIGLVTRRTREAAFQAFDKKGARLPLETEALVGTLFGALGLAALLTTWIVVRAAIHPWLAPGMVGTGLIVLGVVTSRRISPTPRNEEESPPSAIPDDEPVDRTILAYLPGSGLEEECPRPDDGRAVGILYEIPEENLDSFREAMAVLASVRRRQGALHWRLSRDLENSRHFTESYLLESWSDYQEVLRHESAEDRAAKQRVFDLNDWNSLPYESHQAIAEV